MHATVRILSSSSRAWIARQSKDPYVRLRKFHPGFYRSRSAFKLLELEREWGGFLSQSDVQAVIDLGAAPGGWSQVISEKLGWMGESEVREGSEPGGRTVVGKGRGAGMGLLSQLRDAARSSQGSDRAEGLSLDGESEPTSTLGRGTIIALDLLPILPIPGVRTLQMDFLNPATTRHLTSLLPDGKADVVLSDMAQNMSGNDVRDREMGREICEAVWEFARGVLREARPARRRRGVLVIKHHQAPLLHDFRKKVLEPNFYDVRFIKPQASRKESSEGYFLCRGFRGDR